MHGIALALLTENRDRLTVLQNRIEGSRLGRTVFSNPGFPSGPTDPVLRQIQDVRTEVVLVDIDPEDPQRAIGAIELIHGNTEEIAVFAIGPMTDPATIVAAMRGGAREYLDRNASSDALIDSLNRFVTLRNKNRSSVGRARIIGVTNVKGGSGATTVAVNTAVALQQTHGNVVLVDFACLGHCALHLNARPTFGLPDALQNLHRIDSSLLDGLMTVTKEGLHLLAGPQRPTLLTPNAGDLARLFDLLVRQYRFIVVDLSNRIDPTARLICDLCNAVLLVAQTDVVSLWSASRMVGLLAAGPGHDRLRLVLNRFKKIPGFTDEDVEKATSCKILWKIPNNYPLVAPAIDKGVPVACQDTQEVSRSFRTLAAALAEAGPSAEGALNLVYKQEKADGKKSASRLLIPSLRANQ
jgi:pilus assembly protein CpaE